MFIHGTFSSPQDADRDFIDAMGDTYGGKVYQFDWSGLGGEAKGQGAENNTQARGNAAWRLTQEMESYDFKDNTSFNIVMHSHGGNVGKDFTQFYEGDKKIDNMVFLATPHRDDYFLDYSKFSKDANILNVFDTSDMVQVLGGIRKDINFLYNFMKVKYTLGLSAKLSLNSRNIKIEVPNNNWYDGLTGDHVNMDSKAVWGMLQNELK